MFQNQGSLCRTISDGTCWTQRRQQRPRNSWGIIAAVALLLSRDTGYERLWGVEDLFGGGNSNICYFHPYLGKIPILTDIFEMGWNHQPDLFGEIIQVGLWLDHFFAMDIGSYWINILMCIYQVLVGLWLDHMGFRVTVTTKIITFLVGFLWTFIWTGPHAKELGIMRLESSLKDYRN